MDIFECYFFLYFQFYFRNAIAYDQSDCHFASDYVNSTALLNSPKLQEDLMFRSAHWEGKFAADGYGVNFKTGLTYRGFDIHSGTGQFDERLLYPPAYATDSDVDLPLAQPQDEAVHLALLGLALDGNSYALQFLTASLEKPKWTKSAKEFAVDQLTRKIGHYEKFRTTYPGFGGYLPLTVGVDDHGFKLLKKNWVQYISEDDVDGAAHGILCWAMVAAVQALRNNGHLTLAARYNRYVKGLAESGRVMFSKAELVSFVPRAHVTVINMSSPVSKGNTRFCSWNCSNYIYLQYFDADLFSHFIYYISDWSKMTHEKRAYEEALSKSNHFGLGTYVTNNNNANITVEKSVFFTADDRLKYLFLPYFDVPIAEEMFLNGEKARTHFSRDNGYPGLFAAVWIYHYSLNHHYVCEPGIVKLSTKTSNPNNFIAAYAAFSLVLHPKSRPFGLVWYENMIKGPRMQGLFGATPGMDITDNNIISTRFEWIQKSVIILAFAGGAVNLTRQYLKGNGRYEEFLRNVEIAYAKLLDNESVQGGNVQFALLNAVIKDDGKMFAYCDNKKRHKLQYCYDDYACVKFYIEALLTALGAFMVGFVLYLSVIVNRNEKASYKYFTAHIFTVHFLELVVNLTWILVEKFGVSYVNGSIVDYCICIQWYVQIYLLPMCFITMASVTVLSVMVSIVFPLRYKRLFATATHWNCYMSLCYVFAIVTTFAAVSECYLKTPIITTKHWPKGLYLILSAIPYLLPLCITTAIFAGVSLYMKAMDKIDANKAMKMVMSLLNYAAVPLLWCFGTQARQVWNCFHFVVPSLHHGHKTFEILDEISFWFQVTFGVAHAFSTLVALPPIRRAFMRNVLVDRVITGVSSMLTFRERSMKTRDTTIVNVSGKVKALSK